MEFEWDERKRQANIRKHGLDFVRAVTIWDRPVIDPIAENWDHGELRRTAVGPIDDPTGEKWIAVVYTRRNGRVRIISARPARRYERKAYKMAFGRSGSGGPDRLGPA